MRRQWAGLLVGAVVSVVLANPGKADGYGTGSLKDSPTSVPYQWSGLSVGLGVGAGQFDQNVDAKAWRRDEVNKYKCYGLDCVYKYSLHDKYKSLSSNASDDDWKVFGTMQVGYDRLIANRLLIGAFADFDFFNDADLTFSKKYGSNSLSGSVERDNMWTIGGRLGFLATPRILVYGLAGYSRMDLDGSSSAHFSDPYHKGSPTNLALQIDDSVGGWTVGGGLEAKLEKRVSLKLEYRYSRFDGASAKVSGVRDGDWDKGYCSTSYHYDRAISEGAKLDLGESDVHSVRAVLSFKLGADERLPPPPAPLK